MPPASKTTPSCVPSANRPCSEAVGEGEEVALGNAVYVTRPDNFNQLRRFLGRLLSPPPPMPAPGADVFSRTTG